MKLKRFSQSFPRNPNRKKNVELPHCDASAETCGNPSVETIIAHLSGGVDQAPNLILDIMGKISKLKLIKGLRGGWSKRLKFVYLNYHGQWYLLDKAKVFDITWLIKTLR